MQEEKVSRPVDIEADVREMERRKRVEAIMNSKVNLWIRSKKIIRIGLNPDLRRWETTVSD
jgi:hypothetical protein